MQVCGGVAMRLALLPDATNLNRKDRSSRRQVELDFPVGPLRKLMWSVISWGPAGSGLFSVALVSVALVGSSASGYGGT